MNGPQDRREVAEAVLTAALCAVVTKLAEWAADEARDWWRRRRRAAREPWEYDDEEGDAA